MEKMLVTEALNELKLLDKRIRKEIDGTIFVTLAKTCETNVWQDCTKERFINDAKSSLDSIRALCDRRQNIKNAIIKSNATTKVTVAGIEMTVAEAIDKKNSIEYMELLFEKISDQYHRERFNAKTKNDKVDEKIDELVKVSFGKESKNLKSDEYDSIAIPYRKNNEYSVVCDPRINDLIKSIGECIDKFKSEVDAKLQISNCTTEIEI